MELQQLVETVKPQGSEDEAVISQWVHAIATGLPHFGKSRAVTAPRIAKALERAGIVQADGAFPEKYKVRKAKPSKFRFIDLFAGIGGMRLGFESAGGACVFSSEFDRHAQKTYFANHGDFPFGDITKINPKDIPDHDVLLAGFPCQPFSHAGLKRGIADTRGTLFHDIAAILETKKPRVAVLENVKGLLSNDGGFTLQTILRRMVQLGYRCNIPDDLIRHGTPAELKVAAKHMILKSVDFGIPQNRQRIFIVLWRAKRIQSFAYPLPTKKKTRVGSIFEKNPESSYTISDRLWAGHEKRKDRNSRNGKGFGYGIVDADSPFTNTLSARYYKDGSEILIRQKGRNPRKLTPREAASLQGFPKKFKLNESSVQVYRQFGNSVTVPVVAALAKAVYHQILDGR